MVMNLTLKWWMQLCILDFVLETCFQMVHAYLLCIYCVGCKCYCKNSNNKKWYIFLGLFGNSESKVSYVGCIDHSDNQDSFTFRLWKYRFVWWQNNIMPLIFYCTLSCTVGRWWRYHVWKLQGVKKLCGLGPELHDPTAYRTNGFT